MLTWRRPTNGKRVSYVKACAIGSRLLELETAPDDVDSQCVVSPRVSRGFVEVG